jgi:subtilisin family serine protease
LKNRFIGTLIVLSLSLFVAATAGASGAAHLKDHPLGGDAAPNYVEGRLLLKLHAGASLNRLESSLDDLAGGASAEYRMRRFKALSAKAGQSLMRLDYPGLTTRKLLESLEGHPDVAVAEPDYIISIDAVPNDTEFGQLWSLENTGQTVDEEPSTPDADIDAPQAWDRLGPGDAEVVVAIIDTGVDYTHADLAANMWTNTAELGGETGVDDDGNGYVDDIYGIDMANGDSDPYDDHYHGTHVAGTIAAVTDNEAGIAGIAWNRAKIMALKFLAANGRGVTSDAVACVDYAVSMNQRAENDIVVINASWGSSSASETLKAALEAAAAEGIILSAAAGNSTNDCDGERKHYPSSLDVANVISVAASDQDDQLASFSNYGASEVDIAAPGVNILSAIPGGGYAPISTDPFFDGMEAGNIYWDGDQSTGQWAITDENAFDDNMAWSDSPDGDYVIGGAGEHLDYNLVSLPIGLSAQAGTDLMLGFWLYKDMDPFVASCGKRDTLYVEISGDDGENWTTLAAHTGSDPDWKSYGYAIPAELVTDQLRIRFRLFVTPHGTADGVYIDKIGIGEANAMGAFKFANGTSMAAPHVSGTLALMAALYPEESMDQRISRLYNGGQRLDNLRGVVATDRRINLDASLEPDLATTPLLKQFEAISADTLRIEGRFFSSTTGRVMFHDAYTPDSGVDGTIVSWSDTEVVVQKPAYSGGYFYVIDSTGTRSGRRPMKISLWETRAASGTRRDSGTTALVDDKIYTFGGYVDGNSSLRSWEIYDLDTDTWEYPYGTWMLHNRAHLTSAVLDGRIYLIGGYHTGDSSNLDAVTVFDPATRSFTAADSFPTAACFSQAATVGGKIIVSGGLDADDIPMDAVYAFDPNQVAGQQWQLAATLSQARFSHGTVAVDGKVYIFGGLETWEDGEVFTASGEIYDPATGGLSSMAPMPVAMGRFGATCDDRYIYVVGGTGNDFWYTPMDAVLRYDTLTDTWSSLADRQLAKAKLAAGVVHVPGRGLYSPHGGILNEGSYESTDQTAFLEIGALTDADGDSIPDRDDNCRLTANGTQIDSDADGYGNACDCDLTNDGSVNQADFMQFRGYWGTTEALADFSGDGTVNQTDFMILRGRWGTAAPFE